MASAALLWGVLSGTLANAQNSAMSMKAGCEEFANKGSNTNPTLIFNSGYCVGIIEGLMQKAQTPAGVQVGLPICGPATSTVGQAVLVVIKYMNDNPQELHESFMKVALHALVKTWPCKK
jgi:hypothetical protein